MQVMGTNTWEFDGPRDFLVQKALEFADGLKAQGIAQLRDACIARDQKLMWCAWDVDDFEAMQMAFKEMNEQTGLTSELTVVEEMYRA